MSTVRFNLKKPSEKSTSIMLVYMHNRSRLLMSTGIKILSNHWDKERQRIKLKSGYIEYPGYNNLLDNYRKVIRQVVSEYREKEKDLSILTLKSEVKDIVSGRTVTSKSHATVYTYLKQFIKNETDLGIKASGTIQGYSQLLNVLSSFKGGRLLDFGDLSSTVLKRLTRHMVVKHDYSTNQINKIQRRLITIVKEAVLAGYKVDSTFNSKSWRVSASRGSNKAIALTEDELKRIIDVSVSTKLQKTKDIFLIGVHTGQRFSDFIKLDKQNIIEKEGKKYLEFVQKKTKEQIVLPMNKLLVNIFEKYDGYPPKCSAQVFNRNLKKLCELAEINDTVIIRKFNPLDGVVSEDRKKKYEIVSSHDCRRTFATIMHKKGKPPKLIMKFTGHKNLKTFSEYLNIDLNDNSQLEEFDLI